LTLRKIIVIGVGSFGGFLCKHLSELEFVKHLYIIDDDIVEAKNIRNSVYTFSQIGEYKIDSLTELIQDEISVLGFKAKYEEGKTKLPKADLVIDCRDIVCDRATDIDIRFYISGRVLVIDSRKNIKCHREYKGKYSINLTKSEIRKAAFFAAQIINSNQLTDLRKNKSIQTVDLDLIPVLMGKSIQETLENKSDLLYEVFDHTDRIHGLEEHIQPIMETNKSKDIKVLIAEKEMNIPFNDYVIPQGSLNTSTDLVESLTNLVKQRGDFMNFIVIMKENPDGSRHIELLEETGGS
jgi:hypothetical protein